MPPKDASLFVNTEGPTIIELAARNLVSDMPRH